MEQWNYGRASQQQQGGYQSGSFGSQGGAATSGASQYVFSQSNYGQGYSQQILAKTDDYQVSSGVSSSMGLYNLDSKYPSSGYGGGASTGSFNQKSDPLKRYSESQLDQQALRQQQLLQSALRQGAGPAGLDSGVRSQVEYLSAGRNSVLPPAISGSYTGGRELLGSAYRPETEVTLLGSQSSISSRGVLPFPSQTSDPKGPLSGSRGILGPMYPPASGYSSLEIGPARSGISAISDFAGVGSSRYDDLLDDRMALHYDYERLEDDRVRERGGSREQDRFHDRDRSRERERERERLREKERAWERERVRERERFREKELRNREREIRRRERTPPRPVAPPPPPPPPAPPPRRDENIIRKASPPPPRFSSPNRPKKPEYLCKVEPFSLVEAERDLLSLIRRYPKLFVSADFAKAVTCWMETKSEISLEHPVSFEFDAVDAEEECEAKDGAFKSVEEADSLKGSTTWTVKVMLMSGISDDHMKDFLSDSEERSLHMHNILKFAVLRKERSALMAIGGAWDKVLDGGDPAADENALIRTAIRCTKNVAHLDLQGVRSWTRFMEIHYDRVGENDTKCKEISVFLIPDLSGIVPSLDAWKLEWKQRRMESKHRRQLPEKHDKDVNGEELHKGNANGGISVAIEDKEGNNEVKDAEGVKLEDSKDEKTEKNGNKEADTERDAKNDDSNKDEKKLKDTKEEEKDATQEDKKDKDLKNDDKKPDLNKDRKAKPDRKDKEKKDEEKKETKGKSADKKTKTKSEVEPPATPGIFITTRRTKTDRVRGMIISLDGLLDYDERDKEESTFELSLFAEFFQEMLQYRFGCQIWESFEAVHRLVQARKKEDKKRARENDKDAELSTQKKSKISDKAAGSERADKYGENSKVPLDVDSEKKGTESTDDEQKTAKDIDAAMQEASQINLDELEGEMQNTSEPGNAVVTDEKAGQDGKEQKIAQQKFIVNENLFKAFRYFDRNKAGYLRSEDVRRLVHILGKFLSRRCVKDTTSSAVSESKPKDDFIYYQRIVEKEVI